MAEFETFLLYLALRSFGYLAAILMGLAVGAWLLRESGESEPLIERGGVIFSVVLSLGINPRPFDSSPRGAYLSIDRRVSSRSADVNADLSIDEIRRFCSELAPTLSGAAMNLGQRPAICLSIQR